MTSRVLTTFWRVSPGLKRPSRALSSTTTSIFETIPREELVTKFKSRLRDRPFLPGSTGGGFPEFLAEPRDSFPLGVRVHNRNQSSLAELTEKCMEYMEENIAHSPAILFRDLPAKTTEDFITIAKTSQMNRSYIGGTGYRTLLDEESGVATGTDDPPELTAEPHNEMSYIPNFPAKVFFFMLNEAADGCGGETPLVKNTELISKLDPDVLRKFDEKQIQYVRYMPNLAADSYLSWQHAYQTHDRKKVESEAKELGYDDITWDENGGLYIRQKRSAFLTHPVTGEKIWFNQAHCHNASMYKAFPGKSIFTDGTLPDDKYPGNTKYGDGSEIEPEVLQHIRATAWSCAVGYKWRSGDLLVLDNLAVQHARVGFKGDRRLLARLVA